MKLNCIVVDDSALQRITVTKLINENQFLQLVGEFSNATDAKNCIMSKNIEIKNTSTDDFPFTEMPKFFKIIIVSGFSILISMTH